MGIPHTSVRLIRVGLFEIDLHEREVRKQGVKVKLQDQPLRILELLVLHPGELVTREELRSTIWPSDTYVDFEKGLYTAINRLREALGDSPQNPLFIETVPKHGYRFIAPLIQVSETPKPSAPGTEKQEEEEGTTRDLSPGRSWRDWAVVGGSLIVVLLGLALDMNWRGFRDRLLGAPRFRSLAVLPLDNLSGDPLQGPFADEMTEELITQFSKLPDLRVISRTSVMQYKGTSKRLPQIASELNVDAVVVGAVQRAGDRVRITAQLVDAATDHQLWAETYDREWKDVLLLQSEVASDVAEQCHIKLPPESERLPRVRPIQPDSYEAYLTGRYYWNKRTGDGLAKAAGYFQRAIEKDPQNALAYAGLSDFYAFLSLIGGPETFPPREAMPKAKAAAARARELNSSLAEAHASMGHVLHNYDWNFPEAEREFKQAIALNPNYATAHHWYAHYLMQVGRTQEALAEAMRARELDPLSPFINNGLARQYFLTRQYDKAITQSQKALEIDPSYIPALVLLGMAYEQKAMFPEAIAEYDKAQRAAPHYALTEGAKGTEQSAADLPMVTALRGHTLAVWGHQKEANEKLQEIIAVSHRRYVAPSYVALIYIGLGDKDSAFNWLEKGYQERSEHLLYLGVEPAVDSLRNDPRFASLVKRIGLPLDVK